MSKDRPTTKREFIVIVALGSIFCAIIFVCLLNDLAPVAAHAH